MSLRATAEATLRVISTRPRPIVSMAMTSACWRMAQIRRGLFAKAPPVRNKPAFFELTARSNNRAIPRGKMRPTLLIIVTVLLIGVLPTWPYSSSRGYYPAEGLGLSSSSFLL
ncbi:MAG TPA: DUF3309 domain-containing protein [Roseiarcus sp.]|nr:DUF3309 domain-containing protein [Roseiarcus sp.]